MKALLVLIVLHVPGGHEVVLNADMIVSMREGEGGDKNKVMTGEARCFINTNDGKFVSVVETCSEVRKLIGD
jgi:hypothetical protein